MAVQLPVRAPDRDRRQLEPLEVAGERAVEVLAEPVGVDRGEEADLAEVDREHRDAGAGVVAQRGEDRAVAAEHDAEVGLAEADGHAPRPQRPSPRAPRIRSFDITPFGAVSTSSRAASTSARAEVIACSAPFARRSASASWARSVCGFGVDLGGVFVHLPLELGDARIGITTHLIELLLGDGLLRASAASCSARWSAVSSSVIRLAASSTSAAVAWAPEPSLTRASRKANASEACCSCSRATFSSSSSSRSWGADTATAAGGSAASLTATVPSCAAWTRTGLRTIATTNRMPAMIAPTMHTNEIVVHGVAAAASSFA